jgi:hypothetical protein
MQIVVPSVFWLATSARWPRAGSPICHIRGFIFPCGPQCGDGWEAFLLSSSWALAKTIL